MDNHQNLKCYEGVESVQLRLPEKEFDAYMQDKLRSADSDLEFIKQRVFEKRGKLDVCEIGSGNSKLLYRLEADDVIKNKAVGYEVAESRYRLAEKFKSALQSKLVDNRHQNFLDAPPEEQYDLIIMVDIVLQMIASWDAEAEAQAMDWLYQSIYRGGYIFLELEDFSSVLHEIDMDGRGEYRKWDEFPPSDPYAYGLYRMTKDDDGNLVDEKIFLKREDHSVEKNRAAFKSYTREQIKALLESVGFSVEICDYYNTDAEREAARKDGLYRETLYRVLAKK